MKTRLSGCCSDRHFEFSKWSPLKTQNFYNFVIHVNICILCVLMINCIPNHTKCVDISPNFTMTSINLKNYLPPKTPNCYNFGPHVNICMTFVY